MCVRVSVSVCECEMRTRTRRRRRRRRSDVHSVKIRTPYRDMGKNQGATASNKVWQLDPKWDLKTIQIVFEAT